MRLKKNIATSETGFIFNPGTGDSFSTNEVGTEIILQMKDGQDSVAIKEKILMRYDVSEAQLNKDYDDLITQLRDHNLLEG